MIPLINITSSLRGDIKGLKKIKYNLNLLSLICKTEYKNFINKTSLIGLI